MDSHSSRPLITQWLQQPTRFQREPRHKESYLVLLQVGFTSPYTVTSNAVRSYRTISTLPVNTKVNHRRYIFCCTCRRLSPPRRYLAPCSMKSGLSSLFLSEDKRTATVWPASVRNFPHLRVKRQAIIELMAGIKKAQKMGFAILFIGPYRLLTKILVTLEPFKDSCSTGSSASTSD